MIADHLASIHDLNIKLREDGEKGITEQIQKLEADNETLLKAL